MLAAHDSLKGRYERSARRLLAPHLKSRTAEIQVALETPLIEVSVGKVMVPWRSCPQIDQ